MSRQMLWWSLVVVIVASWGDGVFLDVFSFQLQVAFSLQLLLISLVSSFFVPLSFLKLSVQNKLVYNLKNPTISFLPYSVFYVIRFVSLFFFFFFFLSHHPLAHYSQLKFSFPSRTLKFDIFSLQTNSPSFFFHAPPFFFSVKHTTSLMLLFFFSFFSLVLAHFIFLFLVNFNFFPKIYFNLALDCIQNSLSILAPFKPWSLVFKILIFNKFHPFSLNFFTISSLIILKIALRL